MPNKQKKRSQAGRKTGQSSKRGSAKDRSAIGRSGGDGDRPSYEENRYSTQGGSYRDDDRRSNQGRGSEDNGRRLYPGRERGERDEEGRFLGDSDDGYGSGRGQGRYGHERYGREGYESGRGGSYESARRHPRSGAQYDDEGGEGRQRHYAGRVGRGSFGRDEEYGEGRRRYREDDDEGYTPIRRQAYGRSMGGYTRE